MNWRGIPSVEEIEAEEQLRLKKSCERKYGDGCCERCPSSTAQGWCRNHPDYEEAPKRIVH